MLYQGIIGGGSSPVEPVDLSPVLLWTNPNPTAEFAAQTVSLNLTEYVGVIIEYNQATNKQYLGSRIYVKKTDNFSASVGAGYTIDQACSRNVIVNNSGVEFTTISYNNETTFNNLLIPAKIYGVKEYVVEPVLSNIPFLRTTTDKGSTTEEQITATFDVTAFNNVDIESYLVKSNPTYGMYVIYKDDSVVVREVADSTVHNNFHIDVSNNTKLKIVGYLNSAAASDLVKFELTNILFS